MDKSLISRLVRLAAVAAGAASLAACATVEPRYAYDHEPPARAEKPGKAKRGGKQAKAAPGQKIGKPYEVNGRRYTPKPDPKYSEVGLASWYGRQHQGKPTANGERFDMNAVSGAHKTLPLPSIVEVTNLENGKRLKVRVNDRGPFVDGRIIDLSQEAARKLGFEKQGVAKVRVRYVGADAHIETATIQVWID
ncbi:septal ring lytic transglycosylase RlpA family protein [Phenylobacterium sp.]|jgi:rare lipoprotein A|uniref:septal ring lytic transglycosylase RlpA family protein n=1 Tax=Phenylobacterium sp. TaxID=1871053 RepID=UPI002F940326